MFSDFPQTEVVRVIDGDTFIAKFSTRLPEIYREMSVRVKGIDTPELRASRECERDAAYKAKSELTHLIGDAKVDLFFCEPDKYYRLACVAFVNSKDISEHMLKSGLADLYSGGTKIEWRCNEKKPDL